MRPADHAVFFLRAILLLQHHLGTRWRVRVDSYALVAAVRQPNIGLELRLVPRNRLVERSNGGSDQEKVRHFSYLSAMKVLARCQRSGFKSTLPRPRHSVEEHYARAVRRVMHHPECHARPSYLDRAPS